MRQSRRFVILASAFLTVSGSLPVFAAAGRSVNFDGNAGAGQTSPTSPAAGKISATGGYAGNQLDKIEMWTRKSGTTDEWAVTARTLDTGNKTWSALKSGLPAGTYDVKAVAFFSTPDATAETDLRTVIVG